MLLISIMREEKLGIVGLSAALNILTLVIFSQTSLIELTYDNSSIALSQLRDISTISNRHLS